MPLCQRAGLNRSKQRKENELYSLLHNQGTGRIDWICRPSMFRGVRAGGFQCPYTLHSGVRSFGQNLKSLHAHYAFELAKTDVA
jgi:hypothetical protein